MYALRAFLADQTPVLSERNRFSCFPIRIGRNPLNDFSPQNPLISSFHARIEERDGKPCIRDLGSRNGVFIAAPGTNQLTRIDANSSVDLASVGFRFALSGCIWVQMEFVQEQAPIRQSMKSGVVLGNLAYIANQPGATPDPRAPQGPNAASQSPAAPRAPGSGVYPSAASNAPVAPQPLPGGVSPSGAPPPGPLPPGAAPVGGGSPGAGPFAGGQRAVDELRTQFLKVSPEFLALQGLRELAASLVPGRPLETTGEVARFITKLHDTVDVFCRCFIPLRQGYVQFVSSLDLAAQRSVNRSASAFALEAATNPESVAMALLDPRDLSYDAPQAVEGILADLMLHHVALLDAVMQGVRALLDELSPDNIEAALAERGAKGVFDSKYRARWTEFRQRFERLSDERQAFSVIFGQDFAETYRQYQRRKKAEGQGLRTDPPWR
ncbi:MAG: FHA domain-containing protein [Polyangiaceae bacterium]|nr:FHA domain-containing protein [Polyangiaceae bacterium]